jgi:UDP-N-acetylglucosamine--N-acetylmuramyl-(pentapeptide) pyrophosphoryl-undecaprenol N-acetylglucosamine transferase
MKNKYICVTGGGTGGHLNVARSFIDEFYNRGYKVIYIGSTKGADKDWFDSYEKIEKTFFLETRGVVNQNFIGKISSLFAIIKQSFICASIFKQYNINQIISVGGFSAAAASFGAIISRRQLFIHEQNSVMGSLNKVTSKSAKEIFSSYDTNSSIRDYPINPKFFQHQRIREKIKTIIFLGGSQGARGINNFAISIAPLLKEKNINIIHQCGNIDYERVKTEYERLNIDVELFPFSKEIITYMDKADFAISRSGASTLWELCAIGLPALYIPFPYAAADHQYYNAKFLVEQNLALLQRENELHTDILEAIIQIDIKTISEKLINSIKKDGVKKIVDKIISHQ